MRTRWHATIGLFGVYVSLSGFGFGFGFGQSRKKVSNSHRRTRVGAGKERNNNLTYGFYLVSALGSGHVYYIQEGPVPGPMSMTSIGDSFVSVLYINA